MSTFAVVPLVCQRCGAQFAPMEGTICAGCRELLCSRHFGLGWWGGLRPRAGPDVLCDRCQRPLARRGGAQIKC